MNICELNSFKTGPDRRNTLSFGINKIIYQFKIR